MFTRQMLLAVWMVSVSGAVVANVPVIKLAQTHQVEIGFDAASASPSVSGASASSASAFAPRAAALSATGKSGALEQQLGTGSFASFAGPALKAGVVPARVQPYVTAPSAPGRWAALLLVLACVLYQGRRSRRQAPPFGFRGLV